jgi:hypothetical protein
MQLSKVSAVASEVAAFAPQFTAFMARGSVVAMPQIAAEFVAITDDLRPITPHVAAQWTVAVIGKRRCGGHRY